MKNFTLILSSISLLSISACSPGNDLSQSKAQSIIESYIENNPIYETGNFETDKLKLTLNKEKDKVEELQNLINEGYIKLLQEKKRKQFLSRDSVWIIQPSLTEKALPYVVQQNKNYTKVVTLKYKLNRNKDLIFNSKGKSTATCTVILDKEKTPFYKFGKDKQPQSNFITEEFKLKYNEKEGWFIRK
ncbi:hypothetical protein [Riemerella columbipharyngis]|uniref:Lipoprotein n=1 Tax=Riemerella columbipharyngis TaxID=1071918 RepID=A0A1G7ACL4_9FLAO|nr:hypothetical protein [Riemerella columbipharyngis]SDE11606.1 hypothetical protein SAMN05421544_103104 [Riemerella columbipharyngis]